MVKRNWEELGEDDYDDECLTCGEPLGGIPFCPICAPLNRSKRNKRLLGLSLFLMLVGGLAFVFTGGLDSKPGSKNSGSGSNSGSENRTHPSAAEQRKMHRQLDESIAAVTRDLAEAQTMEARIYWEAQAAQYRAQIQMDCIRKNQNAFARGNISQYQYCLSSGEAMLRTSSPEGVNRSKLRNLHRLKRVFNRCMNTENYYKCWEAWKTRAIAKAEGIEEETRFDVCINSNDYVGCVRGVNSGMDSFEGLNRRGY